MNGASFWRTAKPCLLLKLSHEKVDELTRALCDPLRPMLVVHLSSTAKGLRVAMQVALAQLKQQHQEAEAFAKLVKRSCCAQLRETETLDLGCSFRKPLTLGHWETLGTLVGYGSLPLLRDLTVDDVDNGDEAMVLLAAALRRSCPPLLSELRLMTAQIGPLGAASLATALNQRAVPSLEHVNLYRNQIGEAGLAVLAPALRQLPKLEHLYLGKNQITDRALASLLAEPTAGVLQSLSVLELQDNQITDEGCAALATALRDGALPALLQVGRVGLGGNPIGADAMWTLRALFHEPTMRFIQSCI